MATRMQQRRGTATQWTTANPVLEPGELGWESDTNKFKIGDGTNTWSTLDYFLSEADLEGSIDDFVPLTLVGEPDGVASLDSTGKVPSAQLDLSGKQDVVSGVSSTEIGYLDGVTSAIQTQLDGKAASSHIHAIADVTDLQTSLDAKLALAGGTMTGKITLDSDPTQALHATTKQYVDNVSSGILAKPQVVAATTANLDATYANGTNGVGATLTANANGAFPLIDGVTVTTVNGQRAVLVKNQTNAAQNGRYNLTTQGDENTPWVLTRCGLCDEANEIPGAYVFVTDGTANGQTGWVQHVDDPATFVVGTDDIDVFQFAGAGTITAGTGIEVTGNQVAVDFDDVAAKVHTHLLADVTDVTATAAEVNVLDGITATTTELNYTDGVTSNIQTQLDAKSPLTQPIEAKTGAYTLQAIDKGDLITCSGTFTVTVPGNIFVAGDRVDFININTGTITFSGSSLTLNAADAKFRINKQWAGATVFFTSATTAVLIGNLA